MKGINDNYDQRENGRNRYHLWPCSVYIAFCGVRRYVIRSGAVLIPSAQVTLHGLSALTGARLLGYLEIGWRILVIDDLPGIQHILFGDRQRVQRDVSRRLLAQQTVPREHRLGHTLIERALRA